MAEKFYRIWVRRNDPMLAHAFADAQEGGNFVPRRLRLPCLLPTALSVPIRGCFCFWLWPRSIRARRRNPRLHLPFFLILIRVIGVNPWLLLLFASIAKI
jgi:hypothetical protein